METARFTTFRDVDKLTLAYFRLMISIASTVSIWILSLEIATETVGSVRFSKSCPGKKPTEKRQSSQVEDVFRFAICLGKRALKSRPSR